MPQPVPVLLTRPEPAAAETAADLRARGVGPVIVAPLMRRVLLPVPPVPGGVLLTSRAGVAAWAAGGDGGAWPAWCVGPRTAAEARAAGLDLRGHAADAAALAEAIPEDAPPLIHLRGAQGGGLAPRLRARGLAAAEAVVYRQDPAPLSPEARAAVEAGPVVAPVYSPRAARLLGNDCPPHALPHLRPVAISPAAAAALPRAVPSARVAARPDGAAMLEAVEALWRALSG